MCVESGAYFPEAKLIFRCILFKSHNLSVHTFPQEAGAVAVCLSPADSWAGREAGLDSVKEFNMHLAEINEEVHSLEEASFGYCC